MPRISPALGLGETAVFDDLVYLQGVKARLSAAPARHAGRFEIGKEHCRSPASARILLFFLHAQFFLPFLVVALAAASRWRIKSMSFGGVAMPLFDFLLEWA